MMITIMTVMLVMLVDDNEDDNDNAGDDDDDDDDANGDDVDGDNLRYLRWVPALPDGTSLAHPLPASIHIVSKM